MGRTAVRITVDTNVLVRSVVLDDPVQVDAANEALRGASLIALTLPCLCEFVWVLRRVYGLSASEVSVALRALLGIRNAVFNRQAVEAGLALLEAGGDFADGVVAHEGRWMGAETFVSFDKKAVRLVTEQGYEARLLRVSSIGY